MPDKSVHAAFLPWGVSIELLSPSDPDRRAELSALGGPMHHLAVSVTDLDATLARLADADLPAATAPQELGGRRAEQREPVFRSAEDFAGTTASVRRVLRILAGHARRNHPRSNRRRGEPPRS